MPVDRPAAIPNSITIKGTALFRLACIAAPVFLVAARFVMAFMFLSRKNTRPY
jgi:hypothetical protein